MLTKTAFGVVSAQFSEVDVSLERAACGGRVLLTQSAAHGEEIVANFRAKCLMGWIFLVHNGMLAFCRQWS